MTTTRDEAIDAAAEEIVRDLLRQAQRTPRDAAIASLGARSTRDQQDAWIARHRPATARSA